LMRSWIASSCAAQASAAFQALCERAALVTTIVSKYRGCYRVVACAFSQGKDFQYKNTKHLFQISDVCYHTQGLFWHFSCKNSQRNHLKLVQKKIKKIYETFGTPLEGVVKRSCGALYSAKKKALECQVNKLQRFLQNRGRPGCHHYQKICFNCHQLTCRLIPSYYSFTSKLIHKNFSCTVTVHNAQWLCIEVVLKCYLSKIQVTAEVKSK
jgi:hypothetical protein